MSAGDAKERSVGQVLGEAGILGLDRIELLAAWDGETENKPPRLRRVSAVDQSRPPAKRPATDCAQLTHPNHLCMTPRIMPISAISPNPSQLPAGPGSIIVGMNDEYP